MSLLGIALCSLIGVALGFFGGGGSILSVPLFVYIFGLEPKQAIASSLLVVGAASLAGVIQHARAGNVRLGTALRFGPAGMAGAYAGGRAGAFIDGALLLLLFAAMMLLTAGAMWRGRRTVRATGTGETDRVRLIAQGFGVGLFTGLVGAGGGFLIVPALALFAGLPMPAAIGTSLVVIAMNSGAAFLGYQSHVSVPYALVGIVTATAIAGSFAGAWLAQLIPPASLRRAFAGFVLAMACLILVRESSVWVGTATAALPSSIPQLVFALLVLGIGIAAGRSTRSGPGLGDRVLHEQGSGI